MPSRWTPLLLNINTTMPWVLSRNDGDRTEYLHSKTTRLVRFETPDNAQKWADKLYREANPPVVESTAIPQFRASHPTGSLWSFDRAVVEKWCTLAKKANGGVPPQIVEYVADVESAT